MKQADGPALTAPPGGLESLILGASSRAVQVTAGVLGWRGLESPCCSPCWKRPWSVCGRERVPLCTLRGVAVGLGSVNAWGNPWKVVCEGQLKSLRHTWRFVNMKDKVCMSLSRRGVSRLGLNPNWVYVVGRLCVSVNR